MGTGALEEVQRVGVDFHWSSEDRSPWGGVLGVGAPLGD